MIFENLKPFYTKLKNQKIIEIESDNVLYDLHNASQFLGFHYNLEQTSLALTWLYYDDDLNNKKLLIELQCEDVMDFYISAKNKNIALEESEVLEEIEYSSGNNFFKLIFRDEREIKISCQKVKLLKSEVMT